MKQRDASWGRVVSVPAPTKGLNTQVALASLGPEYALTLDNWICQPGSCVTRLGCTDHVTGHAEAVKNLAVYSNGTTNKLFSFTDDGVFDSTSAGTVGATVQALTSGEVETVNFATSGGQYLYVVNGVDDPVAYDGTTWSAPAVTGPTISNLNHVETYRQRLYFLHNNKLSFYYLPTDSIAGAATEFRLGSICRRGGYAISHATWTIDGGTGVDDHYVIATSNGELIIYAGGNPGSSSEWTLRGVYFIGKPLGKRCFVKFGGDLLYLCESGVYPLSKALQSASVNYQQSITRNIQPTLIELAKAYPNTVGWQVLVIPNQSLILLNVPSAPNVQYALQTQSGGWSRFTGWDARVFREFQGNTYFATGTKVVKAFSGYADYSTNIVMRMDTAYNSFGNTSRKRPLLTRPILASNGDFQAAIGFAGDFSDDYKTNMIGQTVTGVPGIWDSGLWDSAIWGQGFTTKKQWRTVAAAPASTHSTRFQIASKTVQVALIAIDYKLSQNGLVM